MTTNIRWNIAVSPDTDRTARKFLAGQGSGGKRDLSHFIEDAVRAHILELTGDQAKAANLTLAESDLSSIVEEAVQWERSKRRDRRVGHVGEISKEWAEEIAQAEVPAEFAPLDSEQK